MGEIRIVSPGKTCRYPYPVCKKDQSYPLYITHLGKGHFQWPEAGCYRRIYQVHI